MKCLENIVALLPRISSSLTAAARGFIHHISDSVNPMIISSNDPETHGKHDAH